MLDVKAGTQQLRADSAIKHLRLTKEKELLKKNQTTTCREGHWEKHKAGKTAKKLI